MNEQATSEYVSPNLTQMGGFQEKTGYAIFQPSLECFVCYHQYISCDDRGCK
jgi:hypothetical protein